MRILYPHLFNVSILQSNVIEAGADMKRDTEKEWYYGNKDKERLGPYSFEEVV
jgi:DnaJ family protein C protein 13